MNRGIAYQAVICQNKYLLFSGLNSLFPLPFITIDVEAEPAIFVNIYDI